MFTTKEVSEKTGIKANTLHYYIKAGAIKPEIEGNGRGTVRMFSRTNVIEAAIIKALINFGLSKKRILLIMRDVSWQKEFVKDGHYLVSDINGNTAIIRKRSTMLRFALIIKLEGLVLW